MRYPTFSTPTFAMFPEEHLVNDETHPTPSSDDRVRTALNKARKQLEKSETSTEKLGEENTKMSAINPILRALGWDVEDWEEVSLEYKPRTGGNPVDYALRWNNTPQLFVEAKGYGENLDDIKWVEQCISYTNAAGVRWIVLTDGMSWKLYDTSLYSSPAKDKLFMETTIKDSDATSFFHLITKESVITDTLNTVGDTVKVDTAVQCALETLFNGDTVGPKIVNMVESQLGGGYNKNQIRESLKRCQATFLFPTTATTPPATVPSPLPPPPFGPVPVPNPKYYGVTLAEIVTAGILQPGTVLRPAERKSSHLTATVTENGILFNGHHHTSPSSAGKAARKVADPTAENNPNGWDFWKDENGTTLKHYRDTYLKREI